MAERPRRSKRPPSVYQLRAERFVGPTQARADTLRARIRQYDPGALSAEATSTSPTDDAAK